MARRMRFMTQPSVRYVEVARIGFRNAAGQTRIVPAHRKQNCRIAMQPRGRLRDCRASLRSARQFFLAARQEFLRWPWSRPIDILRRAARLRLLRSRTMEKDDAYRNEQACPPP